ncbi:hypothetical protein AGLY_018363 [Aphis glycines]|uniref:Uncharacterized protein n=1 Tax=Aphis glycines TaxID=307491 RepID=A0A6G0SSW2_APHGL|nr:hypothetical protein AGLY_018363 [Aphis glycines]
MKYFEIGIKSHYAYVIMAQPLSDNAPPFCIAIFGTDNKFTHLDVMARRKVINDLAADEGITVLGYSSDGDTRLLKSMQSKTYDNKINLSQFSQFFVQDTVHIGTKLRTRILKPGIELLIGSYTVSITHLFQLTELYSKDKHLLTNTDLNPDDKMNFNAAEKMCSDQVIELLKNILDSQGTISFLKIMNNVLKSYLNKTIGVKERLYCLWHSVYLLRIWRCSIMKNNDLTLKNNCITSNAYSCIELDALALINIVKYFSKLENGNDSQMFLPWLYSSQTCEKLFRSTRSMTSTYSTVVNFSLKDFIRKLTRIEILNCIQNDLKITAESNPENNFLFPRERNPSRNYVNINEKISPKIFEKLSDTDIEDILCKSLADAKEEALLLGMSIFDDSINQPQFLKKLNVEQDSSDEDRGENFEMYETQSSPEIPDDIFSDLSDISSLINIGEDLQLKDFTDSSTFLNSMKVSSISTNSNANAESVENGPFINILLHNNKKMVIKKSSFCWLLDNKTERVCNDRLRRFINTDRPKKLSIKKTNNKSTPNNSKTKKNNKFKTTSKIYKKSNLNANSSEESAEDQLFTNEESIKVSTYIKPGVFLLVKFAGGRKQTVFKYVCYVCDVNEDDDEIIVQGIQFSLKENDKSTIDYDMICAKLPNPEIVDKTRKLIYQFPGYVTVIFGNL